MRGLIFAVSLFLFAQAVWSQSPYFQHYYPLRKNDPIQVNALLQDRSGFLWIGTDKGLFQFDGTTYKLFTVSDSLGENYISALAQDSVGRIWAGHKNGQLSIVWKGAVTSFTAPEGNAAAEISDILFDKKGRLWFSTFSDGLYYLEADRLYRLDDADGMPDIFIYDLEFDAVGNVWAGTDRGIAICSVRERQAVIDVLDDRSGLPDNIVKKFAKDKNERLWIASEDAGIFTFDSTTQKVIYLFGQSWQYGAINDFTFIDNRIWVATQRSGLLVGNLRDSTFTTFTPWADSQSVSRVQRDREGNVWLASKSGLARSFGDCLQYISGETLPVSDQNILAIAVDGNNDLWFSSSEGLFHRWINKKGVPELSKPLANTRYRSYTVISLFADQWGYIWAGFYGEGAVRINARTGEYTYVKEQLRNGNVLNISGHGEYVWLSTLGGATEIRVAGSNLTFKNFTREQGLSSDYIYQSFIDSRGRVWFATDREGIDRWDGTTFLHYEEGFASKAVYGFAEDAKHRIWANVQGDGLRLVEGDSLKLSEGAVQNTTLYSLSSDLSGNLILISDQGVMNLNASTGRMRLVGEGAGFNDRVNNLNALARDSQGRFYFGTEEGIAMFTGISSDFQVDPSPRIWGLRSGEVNLDISSQLKLKYDQNNLMFQFTGFWYQNPEQLAFQYRLVNYDLDWITTSDHSAVYSSLPPGDYTFEVRVSSTRYFEGAEVASYSFKINPPFWRTALFYIVMTGILLISGYSYIKYRERQLVADKLLLEARVNERTQEIQRKNEEIQAQSEEIKSMNDNLEKMVQERTRELERKNQALEEYAFINAHNLRAPVASILGLVNLLCKLELEDEGKIMITHLRQSSEKLDEVVNSITEAIEKGDTDRFVWRETKRTDSPPGE